MIVVVVDEVLEVDVPQLSKTMSKRKMKLAKLTSTLEVDAKDDRREERDLVEENCVEEVGKAMVMLVCRCGGVLLLVGRGGAGCGHGSATMLNSGRSDGCSKMGLL